MNYNQFMAKMAAFDTEYRATQTGTNRVMLYIWNGDIVFHGTYAQALIWLGSFSQD